MPDVVENKHPSVEESLRAVMSGSGSDAGEVQQPETQLETHEAGVLDKPEAPAETTTTEQPRSPDGKFASKSVKDDLRGQLKLGAAPAPKAAVEPPQHWPDEDKQFFAGLPDDSARERYLNKVKNLESGYQDKFKDVASWKRATEPYASYLQQMSVTPEQAVGYLLNLSRIAKFGSPEEKRWALKSFAQEHGVPFDLPSPEGALQKETPAAAPVVSPEMQQADQALMSLPGLQALQQEIGQLKNALSSRQQQDQQAEQQRVISEIVAFQNATTEAGQPANPYFAEVADDIALLAHAERQAGRKPVLKDIYDKAVWANPVTRAKAIAEQEKQAEQKRQADARERAIKARSAGSSVSGAPTGGAASDMPAKSVLEEVTRQYGKARGRV